MHEILVILLSSVQMCFLPGQAAGSPRQPHQTVQAADGQASSSGTKRAQPRRRRRRPKRRGGQYNVVEIKDSGTIEGVVLYQGQVPARRKIQIVKDQETCGHRRKLVRRIKVNQSHQVAEVVVFLGDIKAGKAIETVAIKPVIDQRTCTFSPHVQVLAMYQPIDIVNNDPIVHNAHVTQNMMTVINPLQPRQGMRTEFDFRDVGPARINCDIHNWMQAWVYVLWHPYYALTASDGSFRISDVPPGEYELVAWQEHLGERTTTVRVEAGKNTRLTFDLTEE